MNTGISFTGLKNIGYARIIVDDNVPKSRVIMNMELTNDKNNKDLTNFRQILRNRPQLKNDINDKFVNIEHDVVKANGCLYSKVMLNGKLILPNERDNYIMSFFKGLVKRVQNSKVKDFQVDPDYHLMREAQEGLVYKEDITNYLDGSKGEFDILKGSGLTEKFDLYFNDPTIQLSEKDDEKLFNAVDEFVAVLHDPLYVKQRASLMDALLKSYTNIDAGA